MNSKKSKEFSSFTLAQALALLGTDTLLEWSPEVTPTAPSAFHLERMQRLKVFDTSLSEMARQLLIEAVFEEALQPFSSLKVFKIVPLKSDVANGFVDYLIAPNRTLPQQPLLCVAEAKKDNFERGLAQCLAEMDACQHTNLAAGFSTVVYGIISNGQAWQFCRRDLDGQVFVTALYALTDLPRLLGILRHVFAACVAQIGT
jgi:hypothetical protein